MNYRRPLPPDSLFAVKDFQHFPDFHNFERKIKQMGLAGKLKLGELSLLNIAHDDWCDIYAGDRCNCDPDIQVGSKKY